MKEELQLLLKACQLCPRQCSVNRLNGEKGFCQAGDKVKIARADLHHWEEPCLSGTRGSGTVFFSHCTLKCVYCQNHEISTSGVGKEITSEALGEIFLRLQCEGAHNINLVTPTHYAPQIIEGMDYARKKGFHLPVVYNSSGYESIDTLKLLEGYIDIYLPDFKYFKSTYGEKYSKAPHYREYAQSTVTEMVRQVGKATFDEEGIMQKGVIVRHLMLPHLLFDSKKIVAYLASTFKEQIYISLLNQYTPLEQVKHIKELNQKLDVRHYEWLTEYAITLGIENGFIQEGDTADESFIPAFTDQDDIIAIN